jgi:hypothetical protein
MPFRTGFQVIKPKEVAMGGNETSKDRAVFLSKIRECEHIENGFGNNIS